MPVSLLALALSAFAIGTTEFVIMGLLPNVANDLQVTIPLAGWLISGYALGVAIGAPIMAVLTAKLPRKKTLLLLMIIFIVGNLMCALSYSYGFLMLRALSPRCVTVPSSASVPWWRPIWWHQTAVPQPWP
ncbi:Inner membrane transport protein ydhP [Ewingella americana]|uniref:Inner membrane transport protein ydhP n=1 Tax=Ewingella americana TaxID=41202 RepID=A0A377N912_9GAMM|nr:Inner membrane transport protein ydhP [Ewingella americana]